MSSRRYDNARRREQATENRTRILDAAADLVTEEGLDAFSVGAVSKRAGLSVPTIYRNFGGREGLLEEVGMEMARRLGAPPMFEAYQEFDAFVEPLFAYFESCLPTLRAAEQAPTSEVVNHGKRRRDRAFHERLGELVTHLPEGEAKAVVAVIRALTGSNTYVNFRDRHGLTPADAASGARWAVGTLVGALTAQQASGQRQLQGEETS